MYRQLRWVSPDMFLNAEIQVARAHMIDLLSRMVLGVQVSDSKVVVFKCIVRAITRYCEYDSIGAVAVFISVFVESSPRVLCCMLGVIVSLIDETASPQDDTVDLKHTGNSLTVPLVP